MERKPSPTTPPEKRPGGEQEPGCATGDCPTHFPDPPREERDTTERPFVGAEPGNVFSPGEAVNEHQKKQSSVEE